MKSTLLASAVAAITLIAFSLTMEMELVRKLIEILTNSYTKGEIPVSVPSTKLVKAARMCEITLGTSSSFNLAIKVGSIVDKKASWNLGFISSAI